MSADFNKASKVFLVYWEENLVAMASVLPLPSGNTKYGFRQHRLVVLPDYQGLGIGTKVNDFLGQYYIDNGMKYFIRTSHVRLIRHMQSSSLWIPTSHNNKKSDKNGGDMKFNDTDRVCGSFQYVGKDYCEKEHKNIILENGVIKEGKYDEAVKKMKALKEKYYLVITTGNTSCDTEMEKLAKSMGVRTELLYIKKFGEFIRKKT